MAESANGAQIPSLGLSANKRWAVLAVMSLSVFMVFVDGTVVNTGLPAISRDLAAAKSELQWVPDGYILILAGLLLAGGTIGDRCGRRRFLALGMVIFGGASIEDRCSQEPIDRLGQQCVGYDFNPWLRANG